MCSLPSTRPCTMDFVRAVPKQFDKGVLALTMPTVVKHNILPFRGQSCYSRRKAMWLCANVTRMTRSSGTVQGRGRSLQDPKLCTSTTHPEHAERRSWTAGTGQTCCIWDACCIGQSDGAANARNGANSRANSRHKSENKLPHFDAKVTQKLLENLI